MCICVSRDENAHFIALKRGVQRFVDVFQSSYACQGVPRCGFMATCISDVFPYVCARGIVAFVRALTLRSCPSCSPPFRLQIPTEVRHPAEEKVGERMLRFFNAPTVLGLAVSAAATQAASSAKSLKAVRAQVDEAS